MKKLVFAWKFRFLHFCLCFVYVPTINKHQRIEFGIVGMCWIRWASPNGDNRVSQTGIILKRQMEVELTKSTHINLEMHTACACCTLEEMRCKCGKCILENNCRLSFLLTLNANAHMWVCLTKTIILLYCRWKCRLFKWFNEYAHVRLTARQKHRASRNIEIGIRIVVTRSVKRDNNNNKNACVCLSICILSIAASRFVGQLCRYAHI